MIQKRNRGKLFNCASLRLETRQQAAIRRLPDPQGEGITETMNAMHTNAKVTRHMGFLLTAADFQSGGSPAAP